MLTLPSVTREYLHFAVTGATSAMPVEIALIPAGQEEPAEDDWTVADEWDGATAKVLVGPGGTVELEDGTYRVWVRVTATPEIPVLRSGLVSVT